MSTEFEFKLPDLGEGMTEGEIVEWHVAVGDTVTEDAPMLEVMSDKATVTIGAPRSGWVRELRFAPGETAKVGDVLIVIGLLEAGAADAAATHTAAPAQASDGPAATAVGDLRDVLNLPAMYSTFLSPKMWIGAAAGALMIAIAVRLRRWREEI